MDTLTFNTWSIIWGQCFCTFSFYSSHILSAEVLLILLLCGMTGIKRAREWVIWGQSERAVGDEERQRETDWDDCVCRETTLLLQMNRVNDTPQPNSHRRVQFRWGLHAACILQQCTSSTILFTSGILKLVYKSYTRKKCSVWLVIWIYDYNISIYGYSQIRA